MKKLFLLIPSLLLTGCSFFPSNSSSGSDSPFKYEYGVFLGIDNEEMDKLNDYKIVVIDAQYFEENDISTLKSSGHTVLSYLNVGSIEKFRPYYSTYEDLTIGDYEHWDEEKWIDVSNVGWQSFVINELSVDLLDKGVDGFFIDNADVFYEFDEDEKLYNGLTTILTALKKKTYITINGGDIYVKEYLNRNKTVNPIMDAVNQETVFTKIDWDTGTFSAQIKEEENYYKDYIETMDNYKKKVFLLEYTTDERLINKIDAYCQKKGFQYYVSFSLELN